MPMPQYEYMLIFLVVVVAIALRRVFVAIAREARRSQETGQAYRRVHTPAPVPTPFQEAAPYQHQPAEPARGPAPSEHMRSNTQAGQTKITREELEQERDKRAAERRIVHTKAAAPRPQVMPQLSGASLVQAVITKEILTRPPSARRPYKGLNRRQNL